MKFNRFKVLSLFLTFILIFGGIIIACGIQIEYENLQAAPTASVLDTSKNVISVEIPFLNSNVERIQIFRTPLNEDGESEGESTLVGILNPSGYDSSSEKPIYKFEDEYVIQNKLYEYYVRYYYKNEYSKSKNSNSIKTEQSSYTEETNLSYQTENATFVYDSENKILLINGNVQNQGIEDFENNFSPAIIISNGNLTQAFRFDSISDGFKIELAKNFLTDDFLNCEIQIIGFTAYKEIYDSSENELIKYIVFLEPAKITLTDSEGEEISDNKIKVSSSQAVDGFDFSRTILVK